MVSVAILGHGVVGSGVAELLMKNEKKITKNVGKTLSLKRILDLREFDVWYADRFTKDFNDILNDEEIQICAEVMGGIHPAFEFTEALLKAGKSVVTSNKELVAYKGAELLKTAEVHGVHYYFEASVGGGIPVIHPIHQCLGANEIEEVAGILNGTTNYILTKMLGEGRSFDDVLKEAQMLGYAERNPAADVEGHDACRKICILADMIYGKHIAPEAVYTEGITAITAADAEYAKSCNRSIKLIGRAAKVSEDRISCMVSPALIHQDSPLAGIRDVFNGILVRGDATGDVLFYGKGAGKLATASAVVGDMMDAVKYPQHCPSLHWEDDGKNVVINHLDTSCGYYLRAAGDDVLEKLTARFGKVTILSRNHQPEGEAAILIDSISEREYAHAVEELKHSGLLVLGSIRVLNY